MNIAESMNRAITAGTLTQWSTGDKLIATATPDWPAIEKTITFRRVIAEDDRGRQCVALEGRYTLNGDDFAIRANLETMRTERRAREAVIMCLRIDYAARQAGQ